MPEQTYENRCIYVCDLKISPLQGEVGVFTMDIQDRESETEAAVLEFKGKDLYTESSNIFTTLDHFNPIFFH